MNRRGFIGSILALGAAPAIVRADSLMRIVSRDALILGPPAFTYQTFADCVRDDLSDIIWDISPMECYFLSMPPRQRELFAPQYHEWATDSLVSA